MHIAAINLSPSAKRTVLTLQLTTITWMLVECSAGLYSARPSNSSVLFAFGSDIVSSNCFMIVAHKLNQNFYRQCDCVDQTSIQ